VGFGSFASLVTYLGMSAIRSIPDLQWWRRHAFLLMGGLPDMDGHIAKGYLGL
jgi:hypothetical protein